MAKERKSEYKPLLFTTTLRNPERIVDFLTVLLPFENMNLTIAVIDSIVKKLVKQKLYTPMYATRNHTLKAILHSDVETFTDEQVTEIITHSPQQHKEAGFEKGWASRFDTWFKFPMELGFVFYEMDMPLQISITGHMLIDAYNEETPNGEKIQNVLLNAMMKYQTNNPFRKVSNTHAPLLLLLQVIDLLKKDKKESKAGISKREIPLIICWTDNNAQELYAEIKNLRKRYGFEYSDETIYELCLKKLGASEKDKNRFKLNKILYESVDEFIRKMRITGVISLRGMGRFVDFNSFEIEKIKYILANYSTQPHFTDKKAYFAYTGMIDSNILTLPHADVKHIDEVKKLSLEKWASTFAPLHILHELENLAGKKESTDDIFKEINAPTRLEFLTAIALKQKFKNVTIQPNYKIDDEGLPTFTASGGMADIECFDTEANSLFEVTLMRDRTQATNEIPAITRHLKEAVTQYANTFVFTVFVAPSIHADTQYMIEFSKYRDGIDIIPYTIVDFVKKIAGAERIKALAG